MASSIKRQIEKKEEELRRKQQELQNLRLKYEQQEKEKREEFGQTIGPAIVTLLYADGKGIENFDRALQQNILTLLKPLVASNSEKEVQGTEDYSS